MVGQLEAALEVAPADAAIEELGSVVAIGIALAGDQEFVLLLGDVSSASVNPATAMTMRHASSAVFSMLYGE